MTEQMAPLPPEDPGLSEEPDTGEEVPSPDEGYGEDAATEREQEGPTHRVDVP